MKYLQTFEDVESLKSQIKDLSQGKRIIFLLSCTKSKIYEISPARRLYSKSSLFSKSLKLVRELNNDNLEDVRILSAKYGLVHPDEVVEPYENTLTKKSSQERREWSTQVADKIREEFGTDNDIANSTLFVFLTGKIYAEDIQSELDDSIMLFPKNMGIGHRLGYLTKLNDTS